MQPCFVPKTYDPFHLCFAEAVRQHRPDFVLEEIKEEKDKASLNMNLGSRIGKLMRQLAQKIKEQQLTGGSFDPEICRKLTGP